MEEQVWEEVLELVVARVLDNILSESTAKSVLKRASEFRDTRGKRAELQR